MKCKNSFLFIFWVAAQVSLSAQEQPPTDLDPYFNAILVADIETSRSWYNEVLGFEVVLESEITEGFTILNLRKGSAALELIQLPGALSPAEVIENYHKKTRILGLFKFGFHVDDLDQWAAFLQKKQVQLNGDIVRDPVTDNRMLIILDPDGNRIQLFEK